MAQKNRAMAAKAARAQRESRDAAKEIVTREASRTAHAEKVAPIVATHWGLTSNRLTTAEKDALVAEYLARRTIRRLPCAEYKPAQSSVNARHIGPTLKRAKGARAAVQTVRRAYGYA